MVIRKNKKVWQVFMSLSKEINRLKVLNNCSVSVLRLKSVHQKTGQIQGGGDNTQITDLDQTWHKGWG